MAINKTLTDELGRKLSVEEMSELKGLYKTELEDPDEPEEESSEDEEEERDVDSDAEPPGATVVDEPPEGEEPELPELPDPEATAEEIVEHTPAADAAGSSSALMPPPAAVPLPATAPRVETPDAIPVHKSQKPVVSPRQKRTLQPGQPIAGGKRVGAGLKRPAKGALVPIPLKVQKKMDKTMSQMWSATAADSTQGQTLDPERRMLGSRSVSHSDPPFAQD